MRTIVFVRDTLLVKLFFAIGSLKVWGAATQNLLVETDLREAQFIVATRLSAFFGLFVPTPGSELVINV
jgi:hypothetical protein